MSDLLNWITAVSLLALAGVLFYRDYKAKSAKGFILHGVILLACVAFLWRFFGFLKTAPVGKGDNNEVYFIIVLYAIMVLGMLASYAFQHFSKEKAERKEWDTVGIKGFVRVKEGQITNSNWDDVGAISESVREWFI